MKKIIRILNLVYLAMAAAAIVIYFTVPFVKVDADVTINKDEITLLLNKIDGAEGLTVNDIFAPNEEITTSVGINIEPSVIFKAFTEDAQQIIEQNFVDKNINSVVSSLKMPIKKVSEAILKKSAKDTLQSELQKAGISSEQVSQEQIDNAANSILNSIEQEGATVSSVAATVAAEVQNIITASGSSATVTTEEIEAMLLEQLKKYGAVNEDGTIENVDVITGAFLYDILSQNPDLFSSDGGDGDEEETSNAVSLIRYANATDPTQELSTREKASQVEALLAQQIKNKLPENFALISTNIFKGMMFALILFVCSWAFLLVFTLIRTFRKDKCYTRLGAEFWVIGIIQILCGIGLAIASKHTMKLVSSAGTILQPAFLDGTMFTNLNLTLVTSMFIPGIFVLACIPYGIIYHIFKKRLKKQIKINKAVDKKIAAMKASQ